jgi:hypothetical protein
MGRREGPSRSIYTDAANLPSRAPTISPTTLFFVENVAKNGAENEELLRRMSEHLFGEPGLVIDSGALVTGPTGSPKKFSHCNRKRVYYTNVFRFGSAPSKRSYLDGEGGYAVTRSSRPRIRSRTLRVRVLCSLSAG